MVMKGNKTIHLFVDLLLSLTVSFITKGTFQNGIQCHEA